MSRGSQVTGSGIRQEFRYLSLNTGTSANRNAQIECVFLLVLSRRRCSRSIRLRFRARARFSVINSGDQREVSRIAVLPRKFNTPASLTDVEQSTSQISRIVTEPDNYVRVLRSRKNNRRPRKRVHVTQKIPYLCHQTIE